MVAPISPRRRQLLRRPAPHFCPDVDLSNYVYGPDALGWSDWRRLRGGGAGSWLCWLVAFLTLNGPTQKEQNWLTHQHLLDERRCHTWDGMTWCFCEAE